MALLTAATAYVKIVCIGTVADVLTVSVTMIIEQKKSLTIRFIQKSHRGQAGVIGISRENRLIGVGVEHCIRSVIASILKNIRGVK